MSSTSCNKIKVKGDDLKKKNIISYGMGHFMNDLCAACWFFYLSYYLAEILNIGDKRAGYIMLAGQLADAVATPLVGIFSDKINTRCGKRTPWYITGTVLVIISFLLIFYKVISNDCSETTLLIYYITFASLFNIGWAAVQVSHMALLPSLTLNKKNKDLMIRIRTGFTFLAQTSTLLMSFVFFWLIEDKIVQYQVLAFCCIGLGIVTSIIFLVLCSEKFLSKNIPLYLEEMRNYYKNSITNSNHNTSDDQAQSMSCKDLNKEQPEISWTYWLTKPDFYAYMLVYMFCRLCINITQSFIPFYMKYILGYIETESGGTPVQIVLVLLISTIGSIVNSLFVQVEFEKKIKNPQRKRLILLAFSSIFVLVGCLPMFFLNRDFNWLIYPLSFFFGIGFSMGLSTVSSCINDVVGSKGEQGAFVYGAYSFADKLSCGIVLAVFIPLIKENSELLRISMPIFPPISLFLAFIIVYIRGKCVESQIKKEEAKEKLLDNEEGKKIGVNSFIDNSRFTFVTTTQLLSDKPDNEQI